MEMNQWFECTVAIDQMQDDGVTRKVSHKSLVDALSFTDAEVRIVKEMAPFTSGDLEVKAVKRVRIAEIFTGEGDLWFRVKAVFITIDEKTQAEKEVPYVIMVQSASFTQAVQAFMDGMKGSLMDYRIVAITETKIEEVYPYQKPEGV